MENIEKTLEADGTNTNNDGTTVGNLASGFATGAASVNFYLKAKDILVDPNYVLNVGSVNVNDRINLALGTMAIATISAIYATNRLRDAVRIFRNINRRSNDNLGHQAIRGSVMDPKPAPENPNMP